MAEESILHKIKQLYEKHKSAEGNGDVHEAELFASKVTELLQKYNLELSEVEGFEKKKRDPVTETSPDEYINYDSVASDGKWEVKLMDAIANNNFCQVLYWSKRKQATVIGTRTNIDVVKYLYNVIRDMIKKMSGEAYTAEVNRARKESCVWSNDNKEATIEICNMYGFRKEDVLGNVIKLATKDNVTHKPHLFAVKDPSKTGQITYRSVFVPQFLKGAVEGVRRKLERDKAALSVRITDLMVLNNKEIEKYNEENHSDVKTVKNKPINKTDAYEIGIKEGEKIKVAKGLSENPTVETKLLE